MKLFSDKDLQQIQQHGISLETIEQQIANFENGFPYSNIKKAASIKNGVVSVAKNAERQYSRDFDTQLPSIKTVKFVPASGAASRMFKALFAFIDSYKGTASDYQNFLKDKSANSLFTFFTRIKEFAFYNDLKEKHQEITGKSLEKALEEKEYVAILKSLLSENGLNYGSLPKGVLKFHNYENGNRTPVEEHLVEGANYCKSEDGTVHLHFTVSPEHQEKFTKHIKEVTPKYEKQFEVKYQITFSQQKPATDTIAVTLDNQPFRNFDGSLLFRPAGHGALIENLNEIDADIIFVKNIDNIVPDKLKSTTYTYKKVLAAILLEYQKRTFQYLEQLENGIDNDVSLQEILIFLGAELFITPPTGFIFFDKSKQIQYIKNKLNRPFRICGMVRNEGEPGGGPFLVKNADKTASLHIVEAAQINMEDKFKQEVVQSATHFNPVDLVCGVKDFKGNKFDLLKFRDEKAGFISQKSKDGKDLKAQELPGLWNGAMADWNTIFVEEPILTFNPVKTVNDLLREEHS